MIEGELDQRAAELNEVSLRQSAEAANLDALRDDRETRARELAKRAETIDARLNAADRRWRDIESKETELTLLSSTLHEQRRKPRAPLRGDAR